VVGDGIEQFRWPYPPLFLPWILSYPAGSRTPPACPSPASSRSRRSSRTPASRSSSTRICAGAARASAFCLISAALIALGPPFVVISGYHGQIDSLAILPAVAALIVWETAPDRRALIAGLLIGVGAATKTVPGLMLLALLPHRARTAARW